MGKFKKKSNHQLMHYVYAKNRRNPWTHGLIEVSVTMDETMKLTKLG